jgi:hypothetical protein
MRKCPACQQRLSILGVFEPTRLLKILCRNCWATVRLNPPQFVAYTIAGGLSGVGIVIGLVAAGGVKFTDVGGLWSLVMLLMFASGRLFPVLEVEDPPLK